MLVVNGEDLVNSFAPLPVGAFGGETKAEQFKYHQGNKLFWVFEQSMA